MLFFIIKIRYCKKKIDIYNKCMKKKRFIIDVTLNKLYNIYVKYKIINMYV